MFYERRIGSIGSILEEAKTMDADAGIRILGKYRGRSCYAFVTRFGPRYTMVVYERIGRRGRMGRRIAAEEAEGIEALRPLLKGVAGARVVAFAY